MDDQEMEVTNLTDADGMPAGGSVQAWGLEINWQAGPLGRGEEREEPNGAFVETVLRAVKQRLGWYQQVAAGVFACDYNSRAIDHISDALEELCQRTQEREARGVEGTHKM